uniref:Ras-GEF domain-containing protein n=1 Tax=Myotis lucifugus TaxID=59463 RepID=G1QDT5_MYOLU
RGLASPLRPEQRPGSWVLESSNRDITEGLVNGFNYSTFLDPGKVHRATDTIQGWTQFTLRLCEARRLRALQKGTLEKVTVSLVPAFPAGNIPHICTLMPTHLAFSRARWFLDELLTRATASVMGTWPDRVQYLGQPLLSPWFTLKEALVLHSRPAPHPVGLVRSLWVELEHLEPTEAQWEGAGVFWGQNSLKGIRILPPAPEEPTELKHTPEPEEGPAPGLEPGPAVVVLEPSGPPALIQIQTAETAPSPTTDYRRAETLKHLIREEKLNILTFPPRLAAEQLTIMDVELFKKVLPHQCLGSIWSQRRKPGKEHVASTVSATVRQFNYVATCVITTCLGDPSMMAQDRAKVVEHWMKVAKVCETLRNFSSLHAILGSLQSVSVHRLKKTWGKVSRRWAVTFQKLCEGDNAISRAQLIKAVDEWVEMTKRRPGGAECRLDMGCVPFLGKYLKDLQMMDTLMEDDLEGNQINLERKEKVSKVLEEIVVLQKAAQKYTIEPEEQFQAWFWALEQLSKNESYIRSCQLESQ